MEQLVDKLRRERTLRAEEYALLLENAAGPVALSVQDGQPFADFGKGPAPLFGLLPQSPGGAALEEVKQELNALVGLAPVKEYVLRLEQNVRLQQRRAAQGLKAGHTNVLVCPSRHHYRAERMGRHESRTF